MTDDYPTLADEQLVTWHVLNVRDARRYYEDTITRRDEELRAMHAGGRSMYQLAKWAGMSNAHMQRICVGVATTNRKGE